MPNGIELRYCGTSRHRFDWWWSEIEGRWLEETEVAELFRELEARVAELEEENRELRQGLMRRPTFDNIEGMTPERFPPGKFELVIACPSCGVFVPESQIKH